MKKTINVILSALLISSALLFTQCSSNGGSKEYKYETAKNDPLNARIYTLDNGLKVYLTVYKDAPRIQGYIAVKVGSKNDPVDATGLAHYLEHMVFKGSDKFGTLDFTKEEPLINQVKDMYETYRQTKDPAERKKIYHGIDSLSGAAAKFAIANEYDKMMSSMGAEGSNAYTSNEQTVYQEDFPANQVDNWLTVQSERFRKLVLRLFHTELEAVYEEKNRTLDNDNSKEWQAMAAELFKKHTYGTQTTIGTIEHLKNPSMKKIEEYFNTYYVPNNMAICMSGDFDPDTMIKKIDQKFSSLKSKEIPKYEAPVEEPITTPRVKEVFGPDAENVAIGFRFGGIHTADADMITMVDMILANSKAGLIDLNLNQKQKVLSATSFTEVLKDYSIHALLGTAKEGQKLEEVKQLLLGQIELIKNGEFPDWIISAIINNMKLDQINAYEKNDRRANALVKTFTNDMDWQEAVDRLDRLSKITKQQVIDFAKANYNNNYAVVYKRTGEDKTIEKVDKPEITPVATNRDAQSDFLKQIMSNKVKSIEPVFVDYNKDIQKFAMSNGIPINYVENTENGTFNLYYTIEMGLNHDPKLDIATSYINYLGTSKYSPEQVQQEFYKLACSYTAYTSNDVTYFGVSGLTENMKPALELFEQLISDPQSNKDVLDNLVMDELKSRQDDLLNKDVIASAMNEYGTYGSNSPQTNILSEQQLKALQPKELIDIIKELTSYKQHIIYYGSQKASELTEILNLLHKTPAQLKSIPAEKKFEFQETNSNVFVVDYDMKQAEIVMLSKGNMLNTTLYPQILLYNNYFGNGLSSVLFQELRESKALAYAVYSAYTIPEKKEAPHYIYSYIGAQVDKLPEAMAGMMDMMTNMPAAEIAFNSAKESTIQSIRTERINKIDVLFNYERAKKRGVDHDMRKDVFEKAQGMTLNDIIKFQNDYVKGRKYNILVLGKKEDLDMKVLEKYGKVKFLTLKDIFGYESKVKSAKIAM